MARPTKFTEETIEKLVYALEIGSTYEGACRYAGISYQLLNEWRHGRGFPKGTTAEEKVEFLDRLTRAESTAEMKALKAIRSSSFTDWRAAAWWLERRRPQEFGKQALEISGPNGGPVAVETTVKLDDSQVRTILSSLSPEALADLRSVITGSVGA